MVPAARARICNGETSSKLQVRVQAGSELRGRRYGAAGAAGGRGQSSDWRGRSEIKEAGHLWSTNLGSVMLAVFGGCPPIDAHKQPSQAFGVGEVKALASFSPFFFNLDSDRISVYRCGFRRLGDKRISLVYFFSL